MRPASFTRLILFLSVFVFLTCIPAIALAAPPVANDDSYSVYAGNTLTISAPGILANDTDPDPGDSFAAIQVQAPADPQYVAAITTGGSGIGAFSLTPNPGVTGLVSFDYRVQDSHGEWSNWATVTVDVLPPPNEAPVAVDDAYSATEDTELSVSAPGVLGNDTDADGDPLTAELVSDVSHGSLTLNADGSFTYLPDEDYYGYDACTYKAFDGEEYSNVATVDITVDWVNDPPSLDVSPEEQSVQYSDPTAEVRADFADDGPHYDVASYTPFPANVAGLLAVSGGSIDPFTGYDVGSGWMTFGGLMDDPAGDYPVTFTMNDSLLTTEKTTTYHVLAEDATVTSLVSPIAVSAGSGGTGSADISGAIEQADDGYPGDITRAVVRVSLVPIGPGATYSTDVPVAADGSFSASFTDIPVNCYSVVAEVVGGYFTSSPAEDILTIYDPDAGFATGGGWFYWPGTTDKTTCGFVTSYGKKGNNLRGSLVMVRHTESGNYRIKSNALFGLAIGEVPGPDPYGWCSLSGKATYSEPGWPEPVGNYTFRLYAEDRNEPGTGIDRIWIEVKDKDGIAAAPLSMASPATTMAAPIDGGNIAIPHKAGKKLK